MTNILPEARLTLRAVFRPRSRPTEGPIGPIVHLLCLDLAMPDRNCSGRCGLRLRVVGLHQAERDLAQGETEQRLRLDQPLGSLAPLAGHALFRTTLVHGSVRVALRGEAG
jgi:hypothetical protein